MMNKSYSKNIRRRNSKFPFVLLFVIVLLSSFTFVLILNSTQTILPHRGIHKLANLWEEKMYYEAFELTADLLANDPLNRYYLYYNGISGFYSSLNFTDYDTRQYQLNQSLYSLRKLLNIPIAALAENVHYVLAKIYFHKGSYYYDLSEKYFAKLLDRSFAASDINEYLGSIYLETGRETQGIELLLRAIHADPRDVLYLTVAQAYEDIMDYQNAINFYREAQNITQNNVLRYESLLGEGRALFKEDKYTEAEVIFNDILGRSSQSSEAYFYLGEIYSEFNDVVRARANWREAYNLDKTNLIALERLN